MRFCVLSLIGTIVFVTSSLAQTAAGEHTICAVQPVEVRTAVGNVPQLPYQLLVLYADNVPAAGEWRQVRWMNSAPATEAEEANPGNHLVGSTYEVQGYILGDNSTPNGFPVTAKVTVVRPDECDGFERSQQPVAQPIPLNKVRLTGNNRLTWNRDLDIDHLLSLDVKQQLYNYRDTYGLPTDGYPEADGWDSPTTKLKGHGSGHYMSALALAYASCPDKSKKKQLLERIRIMVNELRACQERTFVYDEQLGRYREARDLAPQAELLELGGSWADFDRYKQDYQHYGYGYLNAIPAQHCVLIEKYSPYNNEQGVWAPYYSVHKQLAGLIDIATYVDDKAIARKALLIAKDMGLWVWNRLYYRTYVDRNGSQEQRRSRPGNRYEMWNMYIAGEVGGMQESLARLSTMVGDSVESERLLEAAISFDSPAFFNPLAGGIDAIRTRHANQHIPMITGALQTFRACGFTYYYDIASNFWNLIQGRYRYAMGGVGNGEMFRQPYAQMLAMCTNVTSDWRDRSTWPEPTINETCCAYNLAKLTKDLNCYRPDNAGYMDYYERVLYNQIIGSLNPNHYQVLYQYAVGLNASKPWGNETPQSTCCGGTGAENHLKYQEAAYFVNDRTMWVALYMPSVAEWEQKGITIRQDCKWPAERSVITIEKGKAEFEMKLRIPYWATSGISIKVNGVPQPTNGVRPSSYYSIALRQWRKGDTVEITMPFTAHLDFGPDKMQTAATGRNETATHFEPMWAGTVMYGPLVMATTGITSWDEATLRLSRNLSEVQLNGVQDTDATGADANLYTLELGGHHFIPDYYADRNCTHYFRLHLDGQEEIAGMAVQSPDGMADLSQLNEALQVARSRRDAQNAWIQMEVKVPEYAPWASHGYERMIQAYNQAQQLTADPTRNSSQEAVDEAASQLNAALNTMRPGNLPELEDLDKLLPLLQQAKTVEHPSEQLTKAIEYAEMVVRYVSDGSGTADMIERAVKQLEDMK